MTAVTEKTPIGAQPTPIDQLNCSHYVRQRTYLYQLNKLFEIVPHLASHFIVEIRAATQDTYEFPDAMRDKAIQVQVRFSKTGCDLTTCNPYFPRGQVCAKSTPPQLYQSGNDTILACQPSCYNTVPGSIISTIQMPPMFFYEPYDSCLLIDNSYLAFSIDDYNRTTEHPKIGVDTIGTGFDFDDKRVFADDEGNVTPQARLNKYYCDRFHLDFKDNGQFNECDDSTVRTILRYTTGSYWHSMYFWAKDYFIDGLSRYDTRVPPDLPPIDKSKYAEVLFDKELWQKQRGKCQKIDSNILLSQLGITSATRHMTWTNEFNTEGNLVEPLLVYTSVPDRNFNNVTSVDLTKAPFKKIDYTKRRNYIKNELPTPVNLRLEDTGFIRQYKRLNISLPPISPDEAGWVRRLLDKMLSIEFLDDLAKMVIVDKAIHFAAGLIVQLLKKLLPYVVGTIARIATRAILANALYKIVTEQVLTFIARALIDATAAIFTGLATAASGIGVALLIAVVFDLIFELWDPVGVNAIFRDAGLKAFAQSSFEKNLQQYKNRTAPFDLETMFSIVTNLSVTPDEYKKDEQERKRSKRAVDDTKETQHTVSLDGLQKVIDNTDRFHGTDKSGIKVKGQLDPDEHGKSASLREQIEKDMILQTIVWSGEYMVAHESNSDGSSFDWDRDTTATPTKTTEHIKRHLDNEISDEYIENLIFSADLKGRFQDAKKINSMITVAMLSVIGAVIMNSTIIVIVLTVILVGLIMWHNFYILSQTKYTEFDKLFDRIRSEALKIAKNTTHTVNRSL